MSEINNSKYRSEKRLVVYVDEKIKKKIIKSAKKNNLSMSKEVSEIIGFYFRNV